MPVGHDRTLPTNLAVCPHPTLIPGVPDARVTRVSAVVRVLWNVPAARCQTGSYPDGWSVVIHPDDSNADSENGELTSCLTFAAYDLDNEGDGRDHYAMA